MTVETHINRTSSNKRNVVKMFQDPEVRVAQEVPVVRTVLQQRSQVHQEDPGVLEGQEGPADQ